MKYKRCCLLDEERAAKEARVDDEVGRRIQDWAAANLEAELDAGIDEFADESELTDADVQILDLWLHNHREVAGGRHTGRALRGTARPR